MKNFFKAIGLLLVGVFTAVIVYPLLHEAGHSLAAILMGGRILRFHLFPLPYVLCEMGLISDWGIGVVGLSGMLLPFILSIVFRFNHFWVWYSGFVVKGICMLSFVISLVAIACYMAGTPIENEDITQVLNLWPEGTWFCLAVFLSQTCLSAFMLIKEHPLERCLKYFDAR